MANALPIVSENITTVDGFDHAIDLTNGDHAYILQGVAAAALGAGANGVRGYGGNTVDVYGTLISARSFGIWLDLDSASPEGANHVFVAESGTVSARAVGVWARGGANTIINEGAILSRGSVGIVAEGGASHVAVSSTGTVSARFEGVFASGSGNTVVNDGSIRADFDGIHADGASSEIINNGVLWSGQNGIVAVGGGSHITNTGDITASDYGANTTGGGNKVVNHGTITTSESADSHGIFTNSLTGEANRIVNYGTISAAGSGIAGGAGIEIVNNRGSVEGDGTLAAGNDIYWGEGGVVIGHVLGGDGNDLLVGGGFDDFLLGGNQNDTLRGRGGDDLLNGGAGKDILKGGAGEDAFDFDKVTESARGAQRDVILGFEQGSDIIDLKDIDANTAAGGNQAFSFIVSNSFGRAAGQVRAFQDDALGITLIEGDVNGDGTADFQIELSNRVVFAATDFIL